MNAFLKTFFVSIGLLLAVPTFAQEKEIDIQQYNINMQYNAEKKQMDMKVEIDVVRKNDKNIFAVWLNGLAIIRHIYCEKENVDRFYLNPSTNVLTIHLPSSCAKQTKNRITFEYALPLNNNFIQNEMVFLNAEKYWIPLLPLTESALKMVISIPSEYQLVLQGAGKDFRKEGDKHIFQYEQAKTDMSFPVMIGKQGSKNAIIKQVGDASICFNFITTDSVLTQKIAEESANTFEFYQQFLGTCSHTQLNFIEMPGEEARPRIQANSIFFSKAFVKEFAAGNNNFQDVVASQWWGNGVRFSPNTQAYGFLCYSLKDFFELHKNFKGKTPEELIAEIEQYKTNFATQENASDENPLIDIFSIREENNKRVVSLKGVIIAHYLTVVLGDDVWQEFFKELYTTYSGKILDYEGFMSFVKSYDNAAGDITNQLNAWLTTTGSPAAPVFVEIPVEEKPAIEEGTEEIERVPIWESQETPTE